MKFLFVLVAVLGLSCGSLATPVHKPDIKKDLASDFQEFVDLLPLDEILGIFFNYLDDPEVQALLNYIFSEDFKNLVIEVETIPEYNDVINFIDAAGLPVKEWIAALHDLLGIPSRHVRKLTRGTGLRGLVDDIKAVVDWDALEAFYYKKLETSPDFAALFAELGSPEFRGFVDALYANEEIQKISAQLKAAGLDIEWLLQQLRDFFYPKSSTSVKP